MLKTTKKCIKCKSIKQKSNFSKHSSHLDRLQYYCKQCVLSKNKTYKRSINGIIATIYAHQRYRSKRRGYIPPTYSKDELKDWLFNKSKFILLYEEWVKSNYDKNMKPSCDRLDDYKSYSLDNIQLMTWGENNTKGYRDKKEGKNNKCNKSVSKYSKDGKFIESYHSISHASRGTEINQGSIGMVCRGDRNHAGGFVWRYS